MPKPTAVFSPPLTEEEARFLFAQVNSGPGPASRVRDTPTLRLVHFLLEYWGLDRQPGSDSSDQDGRMPTYLFPISPPDFDANTWNSFRASSENQRVHDSEAYLDEHYWVGYERDRYALDYLETLESVVGWTALEFEKALPRWRIVIKIGGSR
ncbi:hypothetical protein KW797_00165 [Candidatus Parcubacteria bacterium]|nr:hypothetical protein [Candidatus Parcubacteria bacterium]